MIKRILLIQFLLISLLFGNVISSKLSYTQDYEEFWDLGVSDYDRTIASDETEKIDPGKIAVKVQFVDSIRIASLSLFINDQEIENIYPLGKYYPKQNEFAIELGSKYLVVGRNVVEFQYSRGLNDYDVRTWIFNTKLQSALSDYQVPKQLTHGEGWKRNLDVSPDGKFIAYVNIRQNENSIIIYNLETNEEKVITSSKPEKKFGAVQKERFYSFAPCWSRDGSYLFYISSQSGSYEIHRAKVSLDGDISENIRLTNFKAFTTDIVMSSLHDRLYFVSSKSDDLMQLFVVNNAEKIKDYKELEQNLVQLTAFSDKSVFSPTISANEKYIAYCVQPRGENTIIEVAKLENNNSEKYTITQKEQDCLFPQWSPERNIIAYYSGKSLYLEDPLITQSSEKLATDCRLPAYSVKPTWDTSGNALYYTSDEGNKAIHKVLIDPLKIKKMKEIALLDDRNYRDNMEIAVTPAVDHVIYNSFSSGSWQIWSLDQAAIDEINSNSVIGFQFNRKNISLKLFDREQEKYRLLAYSPEVKKKNVFLEKEAVDPGQYRFLVQDTEKWYKATPWNFKQLEFNSDLSQKRRIGNAIRSTFLPGWGQKKSALQQKSKFFRYSFLGFAALITGSYYATDYFQSEYEKQDNIPDLLENRYEYERFNSITNGLIVTGSLYYLLNIFDAYYSDLQIPDDLEEKHKKNYYNIRKNIPMKRRMYNKPNDGSGELKLALNVPNVEIYLSKLDDSEAQLEYFGKTNCVLDEKTHFTISELEPGEYKLVCKKDFYQQIEKTIKIDEYKTSYEILIMDKKKLSGFRKFCNHSVPGLAQFQRNDNIKGFTISGIAAASLLGALISDLEVNQSYDDYQKADEVGKVVEMRSEYDQNRVQRDTFWLIFGLNFIYNLYDAYQEN